MGRIKRNHRPMTTLAVSLEFRDNIMKSKRHDETTAQRCDKIWNMYRENSGSYWYEQYEKVKSELLAIKNQEPWWLRNE